jgi:hypothetical protein
MINGEDPNVSELLHTLNEETQFWSGNFETNPNYEAIRSVGKAALKPLFDSMNLEEGPSWAHLQLIWDIANEIDKPVMFEEAERGRYGPVVATTRKWGQANGYLEEEAG